MTLICMTIANATANDCPHGMLRLAGTELERLGHDVEFLDVAKPGWSKRLKALVSERPEMMGMGSSDIGMELRTDDGRLFWDAAQIPYYGWNCDHPCYSATRHRIRSRFIIHGYAFPDHATFHHEFLDPDGPVFATHIGIPDPSFFKTESFRKRNGRLMFAEAGWNKAALDAQYRATLPARLLRILFASIEEARGKACGAFPAILVAVAARHLTYLKPGDDVFNALLTRLDNYMRAERTLEVGTILADYPVDFVGSGWDELAETPTRARFLGPAPFDRVRKMLGGYLGAVSLNPNVDQSVNERVFFALGAGTVPVFDANQFARVHLPHLAPYSFYRGADGVQAAVARVLDDPAAAQAASAQTLAEVYPRLSMRRSMEDIHQIATEIAGSAATRLLPAPPAPVGVAPEPVLES